MFKRLRYLIEEGFDVCSVMGYDARGEESLGEGRIVYRLWIPSFGWKIHTECFEVSGAEMEECSVLFLHYLRH